MKRWRIEYLRNESPLMQTAVAAVSLEPNWVKPIVQEYESDTRYGAIDKFLYNLFYDAKKNGYEIHHRDGYKEIAFIGKCPIYGEEDYRIKYFVFEFKSCKEIKEEQEEL